MGHVQVASGASKAGSGHPPDSAVFSDLYSLDRLLGRGSTAEVWACTLRDSGEELACKVFNLSGMRLLERIGIKAEVAVLRRLGEGGGHPGVVAMKEVLESPGPGRSPASLHVVMEACQGGELLDLVLKRGRMSEPAARLLLRQLASALHFCHQRGVLHRDIKPDNILLDTPADGLYSATGSLPAVQAKLGDFGLACMIPEGGSALGVAGSRYYTAPEMLQGKHYGMKADVWSLGVVLCTMLSAKLPFSGVSSDDDAGLSKAILESQVKFSLPAWEGVSDDAKDLISWMLHPEPEKRAGARDILDHAWCNLDSLEMPDSLPRASAAGLAAGGARLCVTGECLPGRVLCVHEADLLHVATLPVESVAGHGLPGAPNGGTLRTVASCPEHLDLHDGGCDACACHTEAAAEDEGLQAQSPQPATIDAY